MRCEEVHFVCIRAYTNVRSRKRRETTQREDGCALPELVDRMVGAAATCAESEIAVDVPLIADGAAFGFCDVWVDHGSFVVGGVSVKTAWSM